MKSFMHISFICLLAALNCSTRKTSTSGDITANETWSGVVNVTGNINVASGILTIKPGTIVKFPEKTELRATNGGIRAVGTKGKPITFTCSKESPAPASWIGIFLLDNEDRSRFSYCIMEYGEFGLNVINQSAPDKKTVLSVDHTIIRHKGTSAIYLGMGNQGTITRCVLHDNLKTIFSARATRLDASYNYIYNTGIAFINAVVDSIPCVFSIDHNTIYNVSKKFSEKAKYNEWFDFAIFNVNGQADLNLTNNILAVYPVNGMEGDPFVIKNDYNLWHGGEAPIQEKEYPVGSHAVLGDPLFKDATAPDLSLQSGSPALGKASDGTNLGAWQNGDSWPPLIVAAP